MKNYNTLTTIYGKEEEQEQQHANASHNKLKNLAIIEEQKLD